MILDYIILVKPDWEEEERQFVTELNLEDDDDRIAIDIGANIGIYTLLLSHLYPKCKVISIEASPTIFEKLKLNCQLNNLGSNLVLLNKAVSDKDGTSVEFYEKHSMSTMSKEFLTNISSKIITNKDDELHKEIVRTVTIDNLAETTNINEISLLKIQYTKFYCYQVNPFIYSKDSLFLISSINFLTWLKHSSKNEIRSGLGVLISNDVVSERFFNSITDQYQLLCCLALLNSVSKSIFLVLEDNSLTTLSYDN